MVTYFHSRVQRRRTYYDSPSSLGSQILAHRPLASAFGLCRAAALIVSGGPTTPLRTAGNTRSVTPAPVGYDKARTMVMSTNVGLSEKTRPYVCIDMVKVPRNKNISAFQQCWDSSPHVPTSVYIVGHGQRATCTHTLREVLSPY